MLELLFEEITAGIQCETSFSKVITRFGSTRSNILPPGMEISEIVISVPCPVFWNAEDISDKSC